MPWHEKIKKVLNEKKGKNNTKMKIKSRVEYLEIV